MVAVGELCRVLHSEIGLKGAFTLGKVKAFDKATGQVTVESYAMVNEDGSSLVETFGQEAVMENFTDKFPDSVRLSDFRVDDLVIRYDYDNNVRQDMGWGGMVTRVEEGAVYMVRPRRVALRALGCMTRACCTEVQRQPLQRRARCRGEDHRREVLRPLSRQTADHSPRDVQVRG